MVCVGTQECQHDGRHSEKEFWYQPRTRSTNYLQGSNLRRLRHVTICAQNDFCSKTHTRVLCEAAVTKLQPSIPPPGLAPSWKTAALRWQSDLSCRSNFRRILTCQGKYWFKHLPRDFYPQSRHAQSAKNRNKTHKGLRTEATCDTTRDRRSATRGPRIEYN